MKYFKHKSEGEHGLAHTPIKKLKELLEYWRLEAIHNGRNKFAVRFFRKYEQELKRRMEVGEEA